MVRWSIEFNLTVLSAYYLYSVPLFHAAKLCNMYNVYHQLRATVKLLSGASSFSSMCSNMNLHHGIASMICLLLRKQIQQIKTKEYMGTGQSGQRLQG